MDFRGYLQSRGITGALGFVGNDGRVDPTKSGYDAVVDPSLGPSGVYSNSTLSSGLPTVQSGIDRLYNEYKATQQPSAGAGSQSGTDYSGQLAGLDLSEGRLRGLLGTADTKLNQGLGQLQDSYTQESNNANQARSRALEDYGYQREEATGKRDEALGKVDTNARTLNDSLRRILGLASGSGSSAFQFAAPNAVAREATRQRQGVMGDTANDFRNLDTAESRAKIDFDQLLQGLLTQRNNREQELREGILSQKQGIDTQLGDIASQRTAIQGGGTGAQVAAARPYADNYDTRQSEINSLFDRFRPQVAAQPVNPQQVALSNYTTDRAAVNANKQYGNEDYSPYAQLLRKQREQQV